MAHVDGGHAAGLVIYAAIGMNAAYPELQLDKYLNDAGRDAGARGRDSCLFDGSLAFLAFGDSREYTTTNVRELPDWKARLRENRVGALAPDAPVLLYHAPRDELVPFELGVGLRDEWCGRGVNVRLREISGAVDHSVTATALGNPGAIDWLGERFATGPLPQPDECRTTAARRRARTRLRFGFPGGPWRHVMPRFWHVHARARAVSCAALYSRSAMDAGGSWAEARAGRCAGAATLTSGCAESCAGSPLPGHRDGTPDRRLAPT